MNNKLTQEQINNRLKAYQRVIEDLNACCIAGINEEGAAAVLKELRGNRNRFIKRMEAGNVGRKRTLNG
jgi:hypothetical protein